MGVIGVPEGKSAVGIKEIGGEAVDHFLDRPEPVILEGAVGGQPGGVFLVVLEIRVVEIAVCRIVAVVGNAGVGPRFIRALVDVPPGEAGGQMLGQTEGHAEFPGGGFPEGADILAGTDLHRIEAVDRRIVVEEMVVMSRLRHEEARAGAMIQRHQLVRIEILGLPESADILVSEFRRMSVPADVVKVLLGILDVHIPGVPVAVHGDRLRAPVAPDTEFAVAEPVGGAVPVKGFKGGFEGSFHRRDSLSLFCVSRPERNGQ